MELYPKSLREKLTRGYITVVVLIVGFVLISWGNLNNLEEMVMASDIVTKLFDTTLEIRRFEKNYFLYETSEDYDELLGYVAEAEELLKREELTLFAGSDVLSGLSYSIKQYKVLLTAGPGDNMPVWEDRIRVIGKNIVIVAERISEDRREIKTATLRNAKWHLLTGMSMLLVAVFAGSLMFYHRAVKSLWLIEKHMDRISEGEFSLITTPFKDSEFLTLKAAFNRMLIELQERQRHIVQSEKLASLGTLVFGVAHELNNPISNISTSCQILREEIDEGSPEHKQELLEQIELEADRASTVVSSLLEYSRTKEKKQFQLKRAVDETLRLLRSEIPTKISVVTEVPDKIELFADKQKIQQVFINLIKNAADSIVEEGEIVITASAKGSEYVQISVRDSGKGMTKRTLSKIFDPFFSSKKDGKGYGLGLFIVHNIVNEHEGTISVDSSPGHGTMFVITLPIKES